MTSATRDTAPLAALVLGAAVRPGGQPSRTLLRRARHAAHLHADGAVTHVIACGGIGRHPPSEAAVIGRICREAGVPDAAIRLEERSTSTAENIAFALPILRELGTTRVAIVTDGYHQPRARLTARRLGLDCADLPPPAPEGVTLARIKSILREIPAYLWYLARRRP
ncbi:YdcF family protein [Tropicimonas sp. IMCC6043]|uniref:YdcF family protein n=1 Tax=Tropicimonas sp. IMCC6043 TaxID=2510645 RepID=UPI00101C654C|nr:YdcF family protein [Tropicimonas sp. IMCC6043]RYH06867.1 YdcF family protein [Tropicimonas sp. IMCC6043]